MHNYAKFDQTISYEHFHYMTTDGLTHIVIIVQTQESTIDE